MAQGNVSKLRKVSDSPAKGPAKSVVGDEITRHLRELQAAARQELDVDTTVAGLVPAISALARRGLLVSIAVSPDARHVRLSALIDKEWIPWYVADHEAAAELADNIILAFGQ